MARYGMFKTLQADYDTVKADVIHVLKAQGFGILSTIDVQHTLEEKLGKEMMRYEILGACNPQLAEQALDAEPSVGLLLPCNVVLRETEDGTEVGMLDPEVMFEVVDADTKTKLEPLAGDARKRLTKALEGLG